MVINELGNVGIGTTSPQTKLDLYSNTNSTITNQLRLRNTGTGAGTGTRLGFSGGATDADANFIQGYYPDNTNLWSLAFGTGGSSTTNGTIKMLINGTGYVGVGTTSPTATLDIAGSASLSGTLAFRGTTDPKIYALNGENLGFMTSAANESTAVERLTILNSGNVGIGTTSPQDTLDVYGDIYLSGTTKVIYTPSGTALTLQGGGGTVTNNMVLSSQYNLTGASGTQTAVLINPTIQESGTGAYQALYINPTESSLGSGTSYLLNAAVGGSSKFVITNTGNVGIGTTAPIAKLDVSGNFNLSGYATVGASLVVGNVNAPAGVGNLAISGTTTFGGIAYTWPGSQSSNYVLSTNGSGVLSWVDAGGAAASTNYWDQSLGALYPKNSTVDLLIGGQTTDSATFTVNATTGDASASGHLTIGASDQLRSAFGPLNLAYKSGLDTWTTGMVINELGNVGIGTTSPSLKLDVAGGIALSSNISYPGAGTKGIWHQGNFGTIVQGDGSTSDVFLTRSIGDMGVLIDNLGNVGIGSNVTPTARLDIAGSASLSGTLAFRGTTDPKIDILNGENFGIRTSVGGDAGLSERFTILNDGNVGIGTTNPAYGFQLVKAASGYQEIANFHSSTSTNAVGISVTNSTNSDARIRAYGPSAPGVLANAAGFFAIAPSDSMFMAGSGIPLYFWSSSTGYDNPALTITTGDNIGIGTTAPTAKLHVVGNFNLSGYATVGASLAVGNVNAPAGVGNLAISGTTTFGGLTYTWPGSQTGNYVLSTNGSGVLSWVDAGGAAASTNYWDQASGALYPKNSTVDLLIGGQTTASAKFTVNATTGDASASGHLTIGQGDQLRSAYGPLNLAYKSGANAWTTGMVIDEVGNVGIGTTSPSYRLDVASSGSNTTDLAVSQLARFGYGNGGSATNLLVQISDTSVGLFRPSTNILGIATAGTEQMRINETGLVGIGTTNPAQKLDVVGNFNLSGYATVGASLAIGNVNATAGVGNLSISGRTTFGGLTYTWPAAQTANYVLSTNGSGTLSWVDSSTLVDAYWQRSAGAVSPRYIIDDVLFGGTATASAEFRFDASTGTTYTHDLFPATGGDYDLGSASNYWSVGYINTVQASGIESTANYVVINDDIQIVGGDILGPAGAARISLSDTGKLTLITGWLGVSYGATSSANTATDVALTLNGSSGQSVPYMNVTSSGGAVGGIFTINSSGYVGIGTSAPAGKLDIYTSAVGTLQGGANIRLTRDYTNNDYGSAIYTGWGGDGDTLVFGVASNADPLAAGQERMVITQNGKVGIGTTAPTATLDVAGSASLSGTLTFRGTTDPKIDILNGETFGIRTSPGGDAGLTERLTILSNGYVGIGTTAPESPLNILSTSTSVSPLRLSRSDNANLNTLAYTPAGALSSSNVQWNVGMWTSSNSYQIYSFDGSGATNRFTITNTGYVGIGTTNPDGNLVVVGGTNTNATRGINVIQTGNDITGARVSIRKSRGTIDSPSAISAGDYIGTLSWNGYDGTSSELGSYISSQATENWTTTAHGTSMYFVVTPNATTSAISPLVINNSGLIDIAATARITNKVVPTTGTGVEIHYDATYDYGRVFAYDRGGSVWKDLYVDGDDLLLQGVNTAGNVGIGNYPSSGVKLHVFGRANENAYSYIEAPTSGYNARLQFHEAGAAKWNMGSIGSDDSFSLGDADYSAGVYLLQNTTSWGALSDARLKSNVVEETNLLERISQLRAVTYNFRDNTSRELGIIAQELQPYFPELVSTTEGYFGVTYDRIGVIALGGVKELNSKTSLLTASINLPSADELTISAYGDSFYLARNNTPLTTIAGFATAVIANLRAGAITATEITTETFNVAGVSLDTYITQIVSGLLEDNNATLLSPASTLDVASVTADQATFSQATISALTVDELKAKQIQADQIIGLSSTINEIKSASDAAQSLISKLLAQSAEDISLRESLENQIATSSAALLNQISGSITTTETGSYLNLNGVSAKYALFTDFLHIQGTTLTHDLFVENNLITNSINTQLEGDQTLFIQPTGAGSINLLAGAMIINSDGNITINSDVTINGKLFADAFETKQATISGTLTLQAPEISSQVENHAAFSVINNSGTELASIDASGSAQFNSLTASSLIIASPASTSAAFDAVGSNSTVGSATIPAGETQILIRNHQVHTGTLVYITPTSDTQNQVVFVKSKTAGNGELPGEFTVAVNASATTDITFNYWLIQTK